MKQDRSVGQCTNDQISAQDVIVQHEFASPVALSSHNLPPHFAALIVHEGRSADADTQTVVAQPLRPYGGLAWFPNLPQLPNAKQLSAPRFQAERFGAGLLVVQPGPLPGAADWTHLYGDLSNRAKSDDQRVRLPLGLLWFGGNSHDDVLPRHAHGPTELVVGGRLFVQGTNVISARDVYTGMVFWRRDLGDLATFGDYYDKTYDPDPTNTTYNQVHIPGANARGTNMVAASDAIYLIRKQECLVLDPTTGQVWNCFANPRAPSRPSSCSVDGLVNGTAYQVTAIAGNELGNSAVSTPIVATPVPLPDPGRITRLTSPARGAVLARVTSTETNGQELLMNQLSCAPAKGGRATTVPITSNRVRVTGLKPVRYICRIEAGNTYGTLTSPAKKVLVKR